MSHHNILNKVTRQVVVCVVLTAPTNVALAQPLSCGDVRALVAMAKTQSSQALLKQRTKADRTYRARLVFATRWFELHAKDTQAAVALLDLIPKGDDQQETWMTLGGLLCEGESNADMISLGRLRDRFPRELAQAVVLVPERLPEYVEYALVSTQDPHSDYAVRMEAVCRARRQEFTKAVQGLPPEKQDRFVRLVFNPEKCRALKLPELDR